LIKEMHCVYCGSPNSRHSRFCASCNARFPDWPGQLQSYDDDDNDYDHDDDWTGKKDDESEAAPDFEIRKQNEPIPVPRPGEIVGGLFRFTEEALEGRLTVCEFSERLERMEDAVSSAFSSIFSDLGQLTSDMDDYSGFISDLLRYVQFTLRLSFREMSLFRDDSDQDHLRFGRMLAQRAELEYIRIMEMLRSDSRADPFSGQPFVVGNMASGVIEGSLDIREFHERLEKLETLLKRQIEKAGELIRKGFKEAGRYDGKDDDIIVNSIQDFAIAGDLLARMVLNLTNPDEVRSAMKGLIEETLEKAQGESALQDSITPCPLHLPENETGASGTDSFSSVSF